MRRQRKGLSVRTAMNCTVSAGLSPRPPSLTKTGARRPPAAAAASRAATPPASRDRSSSAAAAPPARNPEAIRAVTPEGSPYLRGGLRCDSPPPPWWCTFGQDSLISMKSASGSALRTHLKR